jgi:hypothetical protein
MMPLSTMHLCTDRKPPPTRGSTASIPQPLSTKARAHTASHLQSMRMLIGTSVGGETGKSAHSLGRYTTNRRGGHSRSREIPRAEAAHQYCL